MISRCVCSGLSLLLCLAWQQTTAPETSSRPAGVNELIQRMNVMVRALPDVDRPVTPQQQKLGVQACKLYQLGWQQRDQMGGMVKLQLGLLGLRGGYAAGDPEVMLSGAKLLMREARQSDLESYATYALVRAGIFAADPPTATEALERIIAHPPQKGMDRWARAMQMIAKQCNQQLALELRFLDGRKRTLAQLRGKAVVLDFWASWCDPCIKAIPRLKEFYQARAGDSNFVMISISIDRRVADAKEAIATHGLTWPQAISPAARGRFQGRGIPHTVVISPTGCVLWQGHPLAEGALTMVTDFARRQAHRMKSARPAKTGPTAATAPAPTKPGLVSEMPGQAQADQKLKLALIYRKAGLIGKAKALLGEVIKDYPRTAAAAKAREELSRLR